MKHLFRFGFGVFALLCTTAAMAADTPDVSVLNTVTQAMALAATKSIGPMALGWLGAFMTLQFVISNIGLIRSGADLQEVFAKLMGFLFAGGLSVYLLLHGPDLIDSVGNGIFGKFLNSVPSAGAIITATLGLCTSLIAAIFAIGVLNTAVAMLLVNVVLVVFATGMYMALKVFMLYLELGMVVLLSPLSFSFLGLNALRDQGIAPLKSLLSLAYRAILLGVIYAAFGEVVSVAGKSLDAIHWINPLEWPKAVNAVFAMFCAYPVIAYLAYKSDSIAANLSSGSTSMGPGDVAGAAAAGAAAGAAIATAGTATASTAGAAPQSMANFMSKMNGGGGSISNASSSGIGGAAPVESPPPQLSSMTKGPAWPTRKTGVPIPPPGSPSPASANHGHNFDALPTAPASTEATGNTAASSSGSPSSAQAGKIDRSADAAAPTPTPSSTAGSGANAGIGGSGGNLEKTLEKLTDHLAGQGGPRKPTLGERLSDANQHVAQEKASTHVSINTHHSD